MSHLTRYGKRMRLMLITAMFVACFVCLFAIPFAEKKLLSNQVGYYSVRINDVEIGKANSRTDAGQALADARKRLSGEYDRVVYMNPKYEVVKVDSLTGIRMSTEQLADAIYSVLFSCIMDFEAQLAYTVRIGDMTVTLSSIDDVIALMEKVTERYDTAKQFAVALEEEGSSGDYTVNIVKAQADANMDIVAAALNGQATTTQEDGTVVHDGITGLSFAQDVTVSAVPAQKAEIISVNEAYEAVTKETQEDIVYDVQAGDTVSKIAANHNLEMEQIYEWNPQLSEESILAPGDTISLTLPVSELTVVVTKRETYEEDYESQPQYVEDDAAAKGTNTVVTEGTTGKRKVTAEVSYVNGQRLKTEVVDEKIISESQPQVISVGTQTDSEYRKPIAGTFAAGYGILNGKFHGGVDWLAQEGTSVYAAAEGTVERAGWYSDYGYCIDIVHADGWVTRYGQLSSVGVTAGQHVTAGQLIAYSGNTGDSSEPHLHFEMRVNGTTVNPLNYVNKN